MALSPVSAEINALAATIPSWRAFHGAAIVDTAMVVFGGTSDPTTDPYGALVPGSNDLWVWSTTLRQWSRPSTQFQSPATNTMTDGSPPPQKFLTSFSTQSQNKMMAFVSNTTSSSPSDLLIIDTVFWTWSVPTSPNPLVAPPSRLGAAVGISNNIVFVHGGAAASNGYVSSGVLNDLTRLDGSTFEWTQIANGPSLMYHTMCKLNGLNMMLIFGGSDNITSATNKVYTFQLENEVWDLNLVVGPGAEGSVPSARKGHSAVCLNNTMIVYGGGADRPADDDVWVLDASVTPWVWNRMATNKQAGPGPRTGHSALLNGTNMLVWGGFGAPQANDVNIYILDTLTWRWSSSKDIGSGLGAPNMPIPPSPDGRTKNNIPLIVGIVCGSLALIAAFVGFLFLKRRTSKKNQVLVKRSHDNASCISDAELHLAGDLGLDDKPSYYHHHAGRDSGSSLGGWPNATGRRSIPQTIQGYAMRPLASPAPPIPTVTLETEDDSPTQAGSNQSKEPQSSPQHQSLYTQRTSLRDIDQASQRSGAKVGSASSDPYYPAYLAEHDEEDADRWTFASSLSFDNREKTGQVPPLRYIPSRSSGSTGLNRSMAQSTGSLTPSFPANRSVRRDGSAPSILSRSGSALNTTSIALGSTPTLAREGSINPRDTTTLFNSVSPLDRVSLMCSGLEIEPEPLTEEKRSSTGSGSGYLDPRNSIVIPQWRSSASLHRDSLLEQTISERDEIEGVTVPLALSQSHEPASISIGVTTLDHPAIVTLIQNLPARYKVTKSPNPIHGRYNDILFAVDTDTQQPIVIKSFGRRETWERECRTLRRLRGPCVVELKHVATLVLAETDEPNKPAKIRLTVLERLDESLAEMLQNAKAAKKVALRENAKDESSTAVARKSLDRDLDLEGEGFYQAGPALDESYIKDIVKGVLQCLTWCHSKKIVYCDLKPTNIMRNRDDTRQQWKLIDLEASRVADEECTNVGTVRYCPPEVAVGTEIPATGTGQFTASVTARYSMDLWAFGCLLYELYATRSLIPASESAETVLRFLARPSPETPALTNGLRWKSTQELEIPYFEKVVPNTYARQLIRILLHPDPSRRATMTQVANSDFLQAS
ncbi:F-box only protein 42 [Linnemannia zychae]|nr:F-box only protein 42 [Linnemannia zychae]